MIQFDKWFEEVEANGQMRCDNIYDSIELQWPQDTSSEIYDFVENMMRISFYARQDNV